MRSPKNSLPEVARSACRQGGVGGSFDALAGYMRRALAGYSRRAPEWFWRLLMEPRKLWKRYLTKNEFAWLASRDILARRLGRQPAIEGHN